MSLYNALFGNNSLAQIAMAAIGNPDVGRFRDAWVEMDRLERAIIRRERIEACKRVAGAPFRLAHRLMTGQ